MHFNKPYLTAITCLVARSVVAVTPEGAAPPPAGAPPAPDTPTDIVGTGNYLISNCLYQQVGDLATGLISVMEQTGAIIAGDLTADLIRNQKSSSWFLWSFKESSNTIRVYNMFQLIYGGGNINVNGTDQQPTLHCVRDGSSDPRMQEFWGYCNDPQYGNPIAAQLIGYQSILLCPKFFNEPAEVRGACPADRTLLAYTQSSTLVHEMIHLYGDTPDGQHNIGGKTFGVGQEKYDLQGAFDLSVTNSLRNPQVSSSTVIIIDLRPNKWS